MTVFYLAERSALLSLMPCLFCFNPTRNLVPTPILFLARRIAIRRLFTPRTLLHHRIRQDPFTRITLDLFNLLLFSSLVLQMLTMLQVALRSRPSAVFGTIIDTLALLTNDCQPDNLTRYVVLLSVDSEALGIAAFFAVPVLGAAL